MPLEPESVWSYPRPPRLEPVPEVLKIAAGQNVIAETTRGWRILETSHPPTYYIPPDDVRMDLLVTSERQTWCEFKGAARYWSIRTDAGAIGDVAWSYDRPTGAYEVIAGFLSFYANPALVCSVDGMQVQPQDGSFYGGWITPNLKGPFKGAPGTAFW